MGFAFLCFNQRQRVGGGGGRRGWLVCGEGLKIRKGKDPLVRFLIRERRCGGCWRGGCGLVWKLAVSLGARFNVMRYVCTIEGDVM